MCARTCAIAGKPYFDRQMAGRSSVCIELRLYIVGGQLRLQLNSGGVGGQALSTKWLLWS